MKGVQSSTAIMATPLSKGIRTNVGGVQRARLKMATIRRNDALRARASCGRCARVRAAWPVCVCVWWPDAVPGAPAPRAARPAAACTFRNMCERRRLCPESLETDMRHPTLDRSQFMSLPRRGTQIICLIKAPDSRGAVRSFRCHGRSALTDRLVHERSHADLFVRYFCDLHYESILTMFRKQQPTVCNTAALGMTFILL